ncbi:nucleotidyltransferase family protein [Caldisericum exile]|uniref:Polymerase nucleotidyl transferase domain-containing protein n=1 Tax=Caldisericum exile (strain DSM 21853 / NBRC 104410 / AZM16c01) TaxID=511051 RepID=A0A7U6JGF2_CALEA|nr:nucleotidyltransferase [Caldisericum exile]BAL81634.1 hypothetical protein CSE_15080 [Caldisericum exile AZM16c01]
MRKKSRGIFKKDKSKELSKDEIIKILTKNRKILGKFKVKRIGIFGSFVRNKATSKSDVDLYVEFEEPTLENFIGLSSTLEKLFKRKVDILTPLGIESIRIPSVKEEIKKSIEYV